MTSNSVAVIRYQYDNHLGSASLELDENAEIISYEEYHPFGTTSYRSGRTETETSQKRYKYVGKERDEETGLYYYGFRYYAAWLCRFVSVDPLQFDYPQLTPFQYAGNKPITHIDIEGLQSSGDDKLGLTTQTLSDENESGCFKLIVGSTLTKETTKNTMKVVYKKTAETGIKGGFSWANLFKGGLISVVCGITAELFVSHETQYTLEELEELYFGEQIPADFRNSAKSVELFLNDARQRGLIPRINTDFADEFEEDDETNIFLYRAMSMDGDGKPLVAANGAPIFAKHLGAKENDLIDLRNPDGTVSPGKNRGGMSTSLIPTFSAQNIMTDIEKGKKTIFKIKISDIIQSGLLPDNDHGEHVSIQPIVTMKEELYQSLIKQTREKWIPVQIKR